MMALVALTVYLIVRSNRRFREKETKESGDALYMAIQTFEDRTKSWNLFQIYLTQRQLKFMIYAETCYRNIVTAFLTENARMLGKTESGLQWEKSLLKSTWRKETLCLRLVPRETAIEKSTWFHLSNSCCMGILYNLRRINETCREHVDNNFRPLPNRYVSEFELIRSCIGSLFSEVILLLNDNTPESVPALRRRCDEIKDTVSETYHRLFRQLREGDPSSMTVVYVYLNLLQETQEMVSGLRKYLRAYAKLQDSDFNSCRKSAAAGL